MLLSGKLRGEPNLSTGASLLRNTAEGKEIILIGVSGSLNVREITMHRLMLLIFATAILGTSLSAQQQGQGSQAPSAGAAVNAANKTPEGKSGKHHHHHKHHHKKS
jgi:hypothetical protein